MRCTVNIPGSKPDTQRSQVLGATYSSSTKRLTLMDEMYWGKHFDIVSDKDLIAIRRYILDHEVVDIYECIS